METTGYFLNKIDIILNHITEINLIIVFILLIIFYHFLLFLIRDIKYIKAFNKYKDPENITITDLKDIPLLNIIIPAWNEGETFRQCLKSITKLNYPKLNVIVNVGGDKETIEIAELFKKYDYFKILNQKPGGKLKALNQCFPHVSEGILYLVDADVYFEDEIVLRMLYPLVNQGENVVIGNVRPLISQRNIDLVNYLYINDNVNFRLKFSRYGKQSISGANTALSYKVLNTIKKFTEDRIYDVEMSQGEDILIKGFKIYRLTNYQGRIYSEFPSTIKAWIKQKIRWNENYLVFSYQLKKINLIKFLFLLIVSIYLLVFPFLILFHFGFTLLGLYILLFLYLIKIRRIVFKKITDKEYFTSLKFKFFLKIIFYIYIEALVYVYFSLESLFFGKKYLKKRKNITV